MTDNLHKLAEERGKVYGDQLQPRVLPTTYHGVKFRSRLEARWAAYFDMIGVAWQYEPEGYQLDRGNYCPDFWCPSPHNFFVEVKPTPEARAMVVDKLRSLAKMTGRDVFCVVGVPSVNQQWGCGEDGKEIEGGIFCYYAFTTKRWGVPYFGENDYFKDEPYYHQAANMRFENGVA